MYLSTFEGSMFPAIGFLFRLSSEHQKSRLEAGATATAAQRPI
jgi:hypothetical protein